MARVPRLCRGAASFLHLLLVLPVLKTQASVFSYYPLDSSYEDAVGPNTKPGFMQALEPGVCGNSLTLAPDEHVVLPSQGAPLGQASFTLSCFVWVREGGSRHLLSLGTLSDINAVRGVWGVSIMVDDTGAFAVDYNTGVVATDVFLYANHWYFLVLTYSKDSQTLTLSVDQDLVHTDTNLVVSLQSNNMIIGAGAPGPWSMLTASQKEREKRGGSYSIDGVAFADSVVDKYTVRDYIFNGGVAGKYTCDHCDCGFPRVPRDPCWNCYERSVPCLSPVALTCSQSPGRADCLQGAHNRWCGTSDPHTSAPSPLYVAIPATAEPCVACAEMGYSCVDTGNSACTDHGDRHSCEVFGATWCMYGTHEQWCARCATLSGSRCYSAGKCYVSDVTSCSNRFSWCEVAPTNDTYHYADACSTCLLQNSHCVDPTAGGMVQCHSGTRDPCEWLGKAWCFDDMKYPARTHEDWCDFCDYVGTRCHSRWGCMQDYNSFVTCENQGYEWCDVVPTATVPYAAPKASSPSTCPNICTLSLYTCSLVIGCVPKAQTECEAEGGVYCPTDPSPQNTVGPTPGPLPGPVVTDVPLSSPSPSALTSPLPSVSPSPTDPHADPRTTASPQSQVPAAFSSGPPGPSKEPPTGDAPTVSPPPSTVHNSSLAAEEILTRVDRHTALLQTGSTVAGLASLGGGSSGSALRMVVAAKACEHTQRLDHRHGGLPFLLHPTQIVISGSTSIGMVLGNLGICAAFTLLCVGVVAAVDRVAGAGWTDCFERLDAQGAFRTPSAPLFVFQFLYQGTTMGLMRLLFTSPVQGSVALGVGAMAICLVVPCSVFFAVQRGVPAKAVWRRDKAAAGTLLPLRFLLGDGEWVSTRPDRMWVRRYASAVRTWRQETAWFCLMEYAMCLAVSGLHAVKPSSVSACRYVKFASALVFFMEFLVHATVCPHARLRDTAFSIVVTGGQTSAMVAMGVGFLQMNPSSFAFDLADMLLAGVVSLMMAQAALDVAAQIVLCVSGRRKRLEDEELTERRLKNLPGSYSPLSPDGLSIDKARGRTESRSSEGLYDRHEMRLLRSVSDTHETANSLQPASCTGVRSRSPESRPSTATPSLQIGLSVPSYDLGTTLSAPLNPLTNVPDPILLL